MFSHIYVEKEALDHQRYKGIANRFPDARIVAVGHYKELFNRPRQSFERQKLSRKLILAIRKKDFLYAGAEPCDPMGQKNFYYANIVMNCPYDCDYCYLQGLYPSANLVMFLNIEDYIEAARTKLKELGSLYLAASYDTDLLALESTYPACHPLIDLAASEPNLLLEIRTKSAAISALSDLTPIKNVILAFTLSPDEVAQKYEHKSPPPLSRLKAAARAASLGWNVRICIDPVILFPGWETSYQSLLQRVKETIPAEKIRDISIGTLRMNEKAAKEILERRPELADLFSQTTTTKGLRTYPPAASRSALDFMSSCHRRS